MRKVFIFMFFISFNVNATTRHDLDFTNMSTKDSYYLLFIATDDGILDHAFVGWGQESWDKQSSIIEAFGFYPRKIEKKIAKKITIVTKKVFGFIPTIGQISDDIKNGSLSNATYILSVKVNKDIFDKTISIRKKWENKTYNLLEQNCIDFTSEIAESIGLKVPKKDTYSLPQKFAIKLIDLNK